MILEFIDGSQIEVRDIFGGPKLVQGVLRDTLRIEVSPDTISFDELKSHFKDNPKTAMLYAYTNGTDEDGNPTTEKNEIGYGYSIFVSISDETRKIPPQPGHIVPDKTEEIYIVQIAQQTYQEYYAAHPEAVITGDENSPNSEE